MSLLPFPYISYNSYFFPVTHRFRDGHILTKLGKPTNIAAIVVPFFKVHHEVLVIAGGP